MKVLVVADQWPWPPHQGDRVRLAAVCEVLSDKHQVTVLGTPSEREPADTANLSAMPLKVSKRSINLIRFPTVPIAVALRMNREIRRTVTTLSLEYDRILFYHLKTTAWLDSSVPSAKVLIDLTDSLGLYYRRRSGFIWQFEASRVLRWERHLAQHYAVSVCSDHDRSAIDPNERYGITISPNGYWQPPSWERLPEPSSVIVVGNWNYYPNRSGLSKFLDEVWNRVRGKNKKAILFVVGRGPNPVRHPMEGVQWIGEVDDLGLWYRKAWLAVGPVYVGAGMKTKIVEALFYGVPVVATRFATEGIEPNPMLLSVPDDGPEAFANAILTEFTQRRRWTEPLRTEFIRRNSWQSTLAPLMNVMDRGESS